MRVLVVDDSVAVRARIVERIREAGLEIAGEAGSAADGLAQAASLAPDAIVLDVHLPDASGLSIIRALKALVPMPVVLVLTIEPRYRERALGLGADEFLDKSTEFDDVAAALATARKR